MGKTLQTIIDGLTYAGDLQYMLVNYTLLVLTLLPFTGRDGIKGKAWILTLITMSVLQVIIWFAVGAVGISVIWCAMAGFNFLIYRKNRLIISKKIKKLLLISVGLSLAAIIYYAITLPLQATMGHVMAVLLGSLLFYLYRWILKEK